jgi:hypothetical protein
MTLQDSANGASLVGIETDTVRLADGNGLKLKHFWGECGIAVDDKVYCWTTDAVPVVKVLPGQ